MTTSESGFISDIKHIAEREPDPQRRRKAAETRLRQLERELERRYQNQPNADRHIGAELADLRRAMEIELEGDPPATVGNLLDALIALTRKRRA